MSRRPATAGTGDAGTLAFLAELSQALAVSLDLDTTLAGTIERVLGFMQAQAASLFLLETEGATPVLQCHICAGPIDVRGLRLGLGQGVVGRAVAENAIQLVSDADADARVWRAADETHGFVTRSLVCAPLATAAGPIGALEIINRRDGRPFSAADAELLGVIAAPAALAINNARMARALVQQQRLKREFDMARRLQRSLLPRRRRDGFPIVAVNRPAHEVSGDFYDYFDLPGGRIGFVVGDVSGKGMDAALLMVRAASLLRWIGMEGPAPADWLARANRELCQTAQDGRFVCALVGSCDAMATHVTFASAGFPPVLLWQAGAFTEHPAGGPPLGIAPDLRFAEVEVALAGGTFYAYSDGATDVRAGDGRPIGTAGVRDLIARHAAATPETRLRALLAELRRLHLVDDTTLLTIEAARGEHAEVVLTRHIRAAPEELRRLRADLRQALDGLGVDPVERDRLVLAVDEACANIIRHGYGPGQEGGIDLRLSHEGNRLTFELRDRAPCADPARLRPRPLGECRSGGFGLALIDAVMDDWHLEPAPGGCGNRLVLHKRIAAIDEEDAGTP